MISFENKGILDLDALRAFGVNVKGNDSAIGHFGTGLKYAIAITQRLGLNINLYLDGRHYTFHTREKVIRGKPFDFIIMNHPDGSEEQLGFTTELGKDWEKWMAFRELYCNAKDEGGGIGSSLSPGGNTIITVEGMDDIYYEFGKYFIDDEPVARTQNVDIHAGPTEFIFYRGIRVLKLKYPSRFKYNIKVKMPLTEDRTIATAFLISDEIAISIARCKNKQVVHDAVTASEQTFEGELDYPRYTKPSNEFMDVMCPLRNDHSGRVNPDAIELYRRAANISLEDEKTIDADESQRRMIDKGLGILSAAGYEISEEIRVVETLGKDVLAGYKSGIIYISTEAFERGMLSILMALFEEHMHNKGYKDYSRQYQNMLLQKLMVCLARQAGEVV